MKKPLQKDIYREMKYGKKELTIASVSILILSLALVAVGVFMIIRGALNPNGAWQIIWRVLLGVVSMVIGGILLGVGITMFAVTRSMINVAKGNVSDMDNRAMETVNVLKCEKCGLKLSYDAKFCKECGEPVELDVCEQCGKPILKGTKFCEECGKGVKKTNK